MARRTAPQQTGPAVKGNHVVNNLDILIVEDELFQREMLRDFLRKAGHRATEAESGEKALQLLEKGCFDLMLMDFRMPGMNGIETLQKVKTIDPEIDVVIMTAYGTVETTVAAMKAGAGDYITKPMDLDELAMLIHRVAEHRTLVRENEILRQEFKIVGVASDAIQYKSPKMAELIQLAARIAPSQTTVMIQGETGTGKELFARLIHHLGSRAAKPFVAVNCAAIPETLIESEFFGHEKGAFTGAFQRRIGRFEQADGGTLFLDEIGELSPAVQVKLLRFLQEREFQRVGGEKTITADVRIISATHQDLEARVKDGTFREDLFYRIHVVAIKIPPLKERREDIPVLITHFIRRFGNANRKKIAGVSREAQDLLVKYDYPGNVRELENIIERAIVIARGSVISNEDLPFQNQVCGNGEAGTTKTPAGNLHQAIAAMEREMIEDAMQQADFNQSKAALLLGLGERMLRYKLKKYGLK